MDLSWVNSEHIEQPGQFVADLSIITLILHETDYRTYTMPIDEY